MKTDLNYLNHLMSLALQQAEKAASEGEVPIGAVVARGDEILASAHNLTETLQRATAHAECLAIEKASQKTGTWRLQDAVLCVTLEPCVMCMGAIKLARIPVLVFGARDEQRGAAGSLYDLSAEDGIPRIISGIHEEACRCVIDNFFQKKRQS